MIRRVDADATITTVAGQPGEAGFAGDGGAATEAKLSSPHAVAVTPDGGFLIADTGNQVVRRVAPDGTITTVAGSGPTSGANGGYAGDGGPATEALLNRPKGLAATAAGDFLIADESNHRIRFVDADLVPPEPPHPEPEPAAAFAATLDDQRLRAHRGERVKLRYTSTMEAAVELTVRGGGRAVAHRGAAAAPGRNALTLGRRLTRRRLEPGRYRLILSAESADGQSAQDRARLKVLGGRP